VPRYKQYRLSLARFPATAQLCVFGVYSSGLCTWNLMISERLLLCSSVPWSVRSCDRFFTDCWQAAFSWYNADRHSTKAIQHRWYDACILPWLIWRPRSCSSALTLFCVKIIRQWRRGVAVERRIRDREVAGSSLGRALRRRNSGQVSHTYG